MAGSWKIGVVGRLLSDQRQARVEEEKIAKREQERIAKAEALKLKREQTKRGKELASQARAQAKVAAAKAKAADDAQVEDGDRRKRRRKGGEADDVEGRRRRVPGLQQLTESSATQLGKVACCARSACPDKRGRFCLVRIVWPPGHSAPEEGCGEEVDERVPQSAHQGGGE